METHYQGSIDDGLRFTGPMPDDGTAAFSPHLPRPWIAPKDVASQDPTTAWFGQQATAFAGTEIGYLGQIVPPMYSIIALIAGAALIVALVRIIIAKM